MRLNIHEVNVDPDECFTVVRSAPDGEVFNRLHKHEVDMLLTLSDEGEGMFCPEDTGIEVREAQAHAGQEREMATWETSIAEETFAVLVIRLQSNDLMAPEELEQHGTEERACMVEVWNLLKCFLKTVNMEDYQGLKVSDIEIANSRLNIQRSSRLSRLGRSIVVGAP